MSKKFWLLCAAVIAALVALIAVVAGNASATPTPTTTYVIVVWSEPTWAGPTSPTYDQAIVSHVGSNTIHFVDPPACKDKPAQYQEDVYLNDQTTSSLIAGGVLHGVNWPHEHLAQGGPGVSSELIQVPACTKSSSPPPSSTTPAPSTSPVPSTSPATSTPPVVSVTPTPTSTEATPELASTGSSAGPLALLGSLLLGTGGLLTFFGRRKVRLH